MNAAKLDGNAGEIDLAMSRAALYHALAAGFRPPSDEMIARFAAETSLSILKRAALFIDPSSRSGLAAPMRGLAAARLRSIAELSGSYRRLFGHTARGSVSPYETEYGSEALFQQPQELGDLMGFYRAFGLAPKPTERERPDHVSFECEFLSFLALKEVYALEHEDSSMLEETRNGTRLFLRDHFARFIPAFAKKLGREDAGGFYAVLGDLCGKFVTCECARLDLSVGPETLSLRPADDDRVPMACGDGGACMAMPGAEMPEAMEKE